MAQGGSSNKNTLRPLVVTKVDGPILGLYCTTKTVVLVQVSTVSFWELDGGSWVQKALLNRILFGKGVLVGGSASEVNMPTCRGILYVEMWNCEENTTISKLRTDWYYCGEEAMNVSHVLEVVNGRFRDVKFVALDDLSIFVTWSVGSPHGKYRGSVQKYRYKLTEPVTPKAESFMHLLCPLKYLSRVHDRNEYVLGWSGSIFFLWNHRDVNEWSSFRLSHPGNTKLKTAQLCWALLKDDVLSVVFEMNNILFYNVLHTKTCARKAICQFMIPESYHRLAGVLVQEDKLIAVFWNGIISWSLSDFKIETEFDMQSAKQIFIGIDYIVIRGLDATLSSVPFEDCVKNFTRRGHSKIT